MIGNVKTALPLTKILIGSIKIILPQISFLISSMKTRPLQPKNKEVFPINTTQHTLIKLPLKELAAQNFNIVLDEETALEKEYLIEQEDSLLFDQIERLRGKPSAHINEVVLVLAKKNPRQEKDLRHVLAHGFTLNGTRYFRFGKSASQAKAGITAFVSDNIFQELYRITQMDIKVDKCVISKYEAGRCLLFSSCTLIHDYMPNIIMIGEYEKTLRNRLVKYVAEHRKEYIDKETGCRKTYLSRDIEEGLRDIPLSPFDGCGCHEYGFMKKVSARLRLDYLAAGFQIRLPFMKGSSVYVPFRQILRQWGYDCITDIYGEKHPVDTIDCIWNTSMFKGHGLFLETYGENAWTAYKNTLRKYRFKLGISKYSHHVKQISLYTRMNFQYLQCLDLWNQKYIDRYENYHNSPQTDAYDILDDKNAGKIITLAKYTTSLFEKIIKGDKFYTYKFMGITDTKDDGPESKYLEAVQIHDIMLKDPAVRQFLYRRLKKAIDEAKVGKIYCSGFYHTGIGDMIGYLQYAAGREPVGCLKEGELYSGNFAPGNIVSFRSPLVDPSEVNRIKIAHNELTRRWFSHLKDQDIVMFNLYDISAPQQGGADFDGDIFLLSDDPILISAKIDKPVILDMDDKTTDLSKPYTPENLIEYEIMTRDSRIGEITNTATSIENRYTSDQKIRKLYEDHASLLRIFQGKEIDFLKTGFRWHMNSGLKKYGKQLPWFLLYNYPAKLKTYQARSEKNRQTKTKEEKTVLNVYHSPSPMNELCDYICAWERRHIVWDNTVNDPAKSRRLLTDPDPDLSDRQILRICRRYINQYAAECKEYLRLSDEKPDNQNRSFHIHAVTEKYKKQLAEELSAPEHIIANYVIYASYASVSVSKAFAWSAYGEYILKNLRNNTYTKRTFSLREVPRKTDDSREYLGKYYEFKEGDTHL